MVQKVFSIHDSKADAFMSPWVVQTQGLAIRQFTLIAMDANSQIGKFPKEFSLHWLGEYNDATGQFTNNEKGPVFIGLASDYINGEAVGARQTK